MKNKFGIVINTVGAFVWFFNYALVNSIAFLLIGGCQLLIAALLLTQDNKFGNIK